MSMSKAILIIDMPSCCTHCKFCNDETGFCKVLSKWVNNISNTRDYKCPLKPLKENYISIDWIKQNIPFQNEEDGNILLSMLDVWRNKNE